MGISQILAIDATQIILIVFIALLVIAYPILISTRNKKENQKLQEQTNSLKRGDKVLTTSGVYGTIVDLHLENDKKVVTIETGTGSHKSYIAVDAYAIYTVLKDEEPKLEQPKAEDKKDAKVDDKKTKTDAKAEVKDENAKPEDVKPDVVAEAITDDSAKADVEAQISGKKKKKQA